MVGVLFQTESHFPVKKSVVEQAITRALAGKVNHDVEVSVTIVGDRRMRQLNKKYRNLDDTTDVLSFPLNDPSQKSKAPFVDPPDRTLRLGDIIVSYPQALMGASEKNVLVDTMIVELILHGLNHLLGIHHPE